MPQDEDIPYEIRITDHVIKRLVVDEQRRIGDANATKTAGRIIERYFAMRSMQPDATSKNEPAASAA